MTLSKNIVSSTKPTTAKEVMSYFCDDKRMEGKRLKSFDVKYDNFGTQTDMYTCYHNVNANHYIITAVFE